MKLLLVSLLFTVIAQAEAPEIAIRIQPHSFVKGKSLTLGDIAAFSGFTPAETSSLKKIALGNAPAFGEKRNYSNQALSEILRAHIKSLREGNSRHIKLQIPDEVSVEGNGLVLNLATVTTKLAENLQRQCEACEFRIEDSRLPEIPAFSPQSTWSVRADYQKLRGPFNLPVEVVNPIGEKSVYWLSGRLTIWKKVPVTTRLLSVQDRLENSDIKWIKRDVTFALDTSPSESEIVGAQIKTSVGPDQILFQSHLVRKRALNRGEIVTLTTGSTTWNINLKGVAQDPGYLGDTVRVLNSETKKIVMGTVVAQGVVEVK